MLVAASKIDACQDLSRIDAVEAKAQEHGFPFFQISSATGEGIEELRFAMASRIPAKPENESGELSSSAASE
jgi:GTP-binding protein